MLELKEGKNIVWLVILEADLLSLPLQIDDFFEKGLPWQHSAVIGASRNTSLSVYFFLQAVCLYEN